MMLFLTSLLAYANPSPQDISTVLSSYNTVGTFSLPVLSTAQLNSMKNGQVVTVMTHQKGKAGSVVGFLLTTASLEQLWLGTQDPHFAIQSRSKDLLISDLGPGEAIWYAYADLPWPLTDRHWINHIEEEEKNISNHKGRVWEHRWSLDASGPAQVYPMLDKGVLKTVTSKMAKDAIYLPQSLGGWVGIEMGDHTLYVYYASLDFGGFIPDDMLLKYVESGLSKMLKDIENRGLNVVDDHYDDNHKHVYGGDKKPIRNRAF